jgi:hypothetical protein
MMTMLSAHFLCCLFLPDQKKSNTGHNHEPAEQLAHGHSGSYETKVGVRLPE